MADEQKEGNYYEQAYDSNSNLRLRDLEEKQNIMKERLLLIGKNLVDVKETSSEKMINVKRDIEIMKTDIERIKSFLEAISLQMEKFAKKKDMEILAKQMKMFRPFAK
tara:strand:- start:745 stop:1068 length:324 start_codon:yes stop_codon:yes gene_type:complete